MDLQTLYQRTLDGWRDRVGAVAPDAWGRQTPCEDWDVRALVNHVTGEDLWTAPLVNGSTIEEVGDRFDGDVLGEDPRATSLAAAAEAGGAVRERLPHHATVQLSYGEESIDEYVSQLAADHLIHGWDLASAVGGDRTMEPELVAAVAAWFAEREQAYRDAGAIGPPLPLTGDPQHDLLAHFGRDGDWAPPTS